MEDYKYLIPEESEDAVSLDATLLRKIENGMRDVFNKYSYQELMLPTFEYVDLFNAIRVQGEESMFQFVNQNGKRIALRTDFTVPIARIYNNSNTGEVKRYSYFGKVYRTQERHKGRSSELYQIGMELMGAKGIEGDRECLSIIEETMKTLDLSDLKLELGSAKFYLRLIKLVNDDRLPLILEKKATSLMKEFVNSKQLSEDLKTLLLKLPEAFGSFDELKDIKDIIKDDELLLAIEEMEQLYQYCENKENVLFDLCMVPSQSYYTGVMIKAYSYYSAYPILSGGRYDQLLSYFDSDAPAIGFSYHLNTLLNAYSKEGEAND